MAGYDPFDVGSFMTGGSVAAKYPEPGASCEGTVTAFRMGQRTDIDSGEPLYWEGKSATEESKLKFEASKSQPCMQLILEIQGEPTGMTWDTNRYIPRKLDDDDGARTMYIHGNMQKALQRAFKDAAAKYPNAKIGIEAGAYIKITRGEDQKVPGSKYFSYTYTAEWTPASANEKAATDFVGSDADGGDPFAE